MVRSLKGSGRQGQGALLVLASHNFSAGAAVQRTSVHTVCMAGHTDGRLDFCINKCFLSQLTAVIALAWPAGLRVLTHAEPSVNVITNVYVTNTYTKMMLALSGRARHARELAGSNPVVGCAIIVSLF